MQKTSRRWLSILISIFGFLSLIGLAAFGGYNSGIGDRMTAKQLTLVPQLAKQYEFALVDMQFGHYEAAKQRLEFIIANDPQFPGAQELLTEVLVKSNLPTAVPTITLTPTADFSGAESAFARAHQLILAQDWSNALGALDQIRKLDRTYKVAQVDGMYYFTLRNHGTDLIRQGNLEGGIYYISLAERFGTLDNTAVGLREGARLYIIGASFWELDWAQAVAYFSQVSAGWGSMWDGTMSATKRFYYASMRYGDQLFAQGEYCAALEQYHNALAIGELDQTAAENAYEANQICYPPTATPDPSLLFTPTPSLGAPTVETPAETPTDTPAPTSTVGG